LALQEVEADLESDSYERINVYSPSDLLSDPLMAFKERWNNVNFRRSRLTWLSLFVVLLLYPVISVVFAEDPSEMLKNLNQGVLIVLLVTTIIMQWILFLLIYVTIFREETGMAGLGFRRLRALDFLWAFSFLLAANLILAGLAWFLARVGLPMPGEIALLIPTEPSGKVIWVFVSFTAGFCEETLFRGYLMTRVRLLANLHGWLIPGILSAVAFGTCHAYQGLPGFIVLTVYGGLFALLYIRTGTIWPCIIAHFFQDFSALIIPQ
jgi:membrane protease YdiL (CAAX protease family)